MYGKRKNAILQGEDIAHLISSLPWVLVDGSSWLWILLDSLRDDLRVNAVVGARAKSQQRLCENTTTTESKESRPELRVRVRAKPSGEEA